MLKQRINIAKRLNLNILLDKKCMIKSAIILLFRLVNMVDLTQINFENVWQIVKEARKSFLLQQKDAKCSSFLPDDLITGNFETFEKKLNINMMINNRNNITKQTLKTAAEVFTYLNFCPNRLFYFVRDILKYESSRNILLSLASIMKVSENAAKECSVKA